MSEQPPEWAQKLLDGQEKQSKDLEAHGETLSEYGEALEELSTSVGELKGDTKDNFTRMGTEFGHLKDRAAEDRETAKTDAKDAQARADKKESELEKKVGDAHVHANQSGTKADTLAGEFKNHTKDEHARIALQTQTDLETHSEDNNRHAGEAPGGGGHVKTAGIAGGAGLLVVIAEFVRQWLTS